MATTRNKPNSSSFLVLLLIASGCSAGWRSELRFRESRRYEIPPSAAGRACAQACRGKPQHERIFCYAGCPGARKSVGSCRAGPPSAALDCIEWTADRTEKRDGRCDEVFPESGAIECRDHERPSALGLVLGVVGVLVLVVILVGGASAQSSQ